MSAGLSTPIQHSVCAGNRGVYALRDGFRSRRCHLLAALSASLGGGRAGRLARCVGTAVRNGRDVMPRRNIPLAAVGRSPLQVPVSSL